MLGRFQILAYAIFAIQLPVFTVWWLWGRRLRSFSAPIGGVLIAGSIVSFVVGVMILPYSIIGMIVLIGVLGFTPFLTFFVYLRNGCRALIGQERNDAYTSRFLTAVLAAIISIGLPVFANQLVGQTLARSTRQIVSGDAKQVELAVNQLRWMPFIPQETRQRIMSAYQGSKNSEQRELLKKALRELTGEDIDTSIMILND